MLRSGNIAQEPKRIARIRVARRNRSTQTPVGVKINLPFITPGDTLYLQGAYGSGADNYTGVCAYSGCYQASGTPTNGGPFTQFLADAVLNPLTGRLQLTDSVSVVGSYLHYWTPSVRSVFYASYSETTFGKGARAAESLTAFTSANAALVGAAAGAGSFVTSPGLFALSLILRDNYQIYAGASLIWSPVKDLDIGVEGNCTNTGMQKGRVIDQTKTVGVTPANFNALLAAGAIHTLNNYDAAQVRFRVQRDFQDRPAHTWDAFPGCARSIPGSADLRARPRAGPFFVGRPGPGSGLTAKAARRAIPTGRALCPVDRVAGTKIRC